SAAHDEFGHIDVLINNAGGGGLEPLGQWNAQNLLDSYTLNAVSAAMLVNELWDSFTARQSGTIVNITSMAVVDPFPGLGPYAMSKAGMSSLTRTIRNEGGHLGIRAFEVAPGAVETDLLRTIVSKEDLPESQALTPDDIALVVEQLVTGERAEDNGAQIQVFANS
ncbi:MAG: SDR family oxidoreductase, partial [Planctomycetota bacterium]